MGDVTLEGESEGPTYAVGEQDVEDVAATSSSQPMMNGVGVNASLGAHPTGSVGTGPGAIDGAHGTHGSAHVTRHPASKPTDRTSSSAATIASSHSACE